MRGPGDTEGAAGVTLVGAPKMLGGVPTVLGAEGVTPGVTGENVAPLEALPMGCVPNRLGGVPTTLGVVVGDATPGAPNTLGVVPTIGTTPVEGVPTLPIELPEEVTTEGAGPTANPSPTPGAAPMPGAAPTPGAAPG